MHASVAFSLIFAPGDAVRHLVYSFGLAVCLSLIDQPAHACAAGLSPLDLNDVKYADVVVVGSVSNYKVIRDRGHARFDLIVSRALLGRPTRTMHVTWDNSTFGEPTSMAGDYVVALRKPRSNLHPLPGSRDAVLENPEPERFSVLQAPCSPAFLFEIHSDQAAALRKKLRSHPD